MKTIAVLEITASELPCGGGRIRVYDKDEHHMRATSFSTRDEANFHGDGTGSFKALVALMRHPMVNEFGFLLTEGRT